MLQESLGDHDHINSVFEDIALSEDKVTDQGFSEGGSPGVQESGRFEFTLSKLLKSQIRYKYLFKVIIFLKP